MKIYRIASSFKDELEEMVQRKITTPWDFNLKDLKDITYVFTPLLKEAINKAALSKRGALKREYVGLLRDCVYGYLHKFIHPEILDIGVFLKKMRQYGATGVDPNTGKRVIVINPNMATAFYVTTLFHEIKHNIDRLEEKREVTPTTDLQYSLYKKLPSERRAFGYEKRIFDNIHKELQKDRPEDISDEN